MAHDCQGLKQYKSAEFGYSVSTGQSDSIAGVMLSGQRKILKVTAECHLNTDQPSFKGRASSVELCNTTR